MTQDMISLEDVKLERDGATTFILNRLDKRNAMSPQLYMDTFSDAGRLQKGKKP